MQFSASQISQIVSGTIEGNSETSVSSFAKIEDAKKEQITFFANPKYEDFLYTTQASVIILNADYKLKQPLNATLIRVADAYSAFVTLLIAYKEMMVNSLKGIEQPCYISSTVHIKENVYIGAFSYIGENVKIGKNTKVYPNAYLGDNVEIGNNCIIHPGVKIYFECVLKNNIIIHSGTVIGSEGFGYIPQPDGTFKKIPQIGNVLIEDNVEIGANTTIDRATMGSTIIKSGVKLDNLIQIAHNVELGKNVVIAAQSGISGSTKLGNNVLVGGQVGLGEHLTIGAKSRIAGGSGIRRSFTNAGSNIMGDPATDYMSYMRSQAIIRKLPELEKRIALLEKTAKNSVTE